MNILTISISLATVAIFASTSPSLPTTMAIQPTIEGVVVTPTSSKQNEGGFGDSNGKSTGYRRKAFKLEFTFPPARVDPHSDDLGLFIQHTTIESSLGTLCHVVIPLPECGYSFHEYFEWQIVKKGAPSASGSSFVGSDTLGYGLKGRFVGCEVTITGKSSFVPSNSPGYANLLGRLQGHYADADGYGDGKGGTITALAPPTGSPETGGVVVGTNQAGWVDQDENGEEDALEDTSPQEPTTAALLAATNPVREGSARSLNVYWNDCLGFAMAGSR